MDVYKISSSDLTNLPFVEHQAKKGKSILLSIGASDEDEINRTLKVIKANNNQPIVLLHCVLEYPTPFEHANLNRIVTLKDNGVGMSGEILEQLKNIIKEPTLPKGSIGVKNIAIRMSLLYGDRFKMEIDSVEGEGSMFRLSFPKIT